MLVRFWGRRTYGPAGQADKSISCLPPALSRGSRPRFHPPARQLYVFGDGGDGRLFSRPPGFAPAAAQINHGGHPASRASAAGFALSGRPFVFAARRLAGAINLPARRLQAGRPPRRGRRRLAIADDTCFPESGVNPGGSKPLLIVINGRRLF